MNNSFRRIVASLVTLLTGVAGDIGAQIEVQRELNFAVVKQQIHVQTGPKSLIRDPDEPYIFLITLRADLFSLASITPPKGPAIALDLLQHYDLGNQIYVYDRPFKSKEAMDDAFPPGLYRADVDDILGGGRYSAEVELPLTEFYPEIPLITNLDEAQGISPSEPFKVSWKELDHGAELDSYAFTVVSNRATRLWGITAVAGDVRTTSAEIPANTLTLGNSYAGVLLHQHWTPAGSDGITNGVFFGHIIQFSMKTPLQPLLRLTSNPLDGTVTLRFNTVPSKQYQVLRSPSLAKALGEWISKPPFVAESGYSEVSFTIEATDAPSFFRVREVIPP